MKKTATKAFSYQTATILFVAFYICVHLCLSVVSTPAQGLPVAAPASVGMSAEKLNQIDALVEADIKDKKMPGAVVIVGHKGKIVFRKAFGNRALVPKIEHMTVDTIFDVASLTKVVATTPSIMILIEQGKLRLGDTIGKYIPDIDDEQVKRVTIQQMLTHVSGFAPDFDLKEKWTGRDGMLAALKKEKLRSPPGTKFVYSDINFIVLGEIVERLGIDASCGTSLLPNFSSRICEELFSTRLLFRPLGMTESGFRRFGGISAEVDSDANALIRKRIAPTENIRGQNSYLGSAFEGNAKDGDAILRGQVHDPTSYRMGGIAGHAGLFSTADDLARYCQMLLNGGVVPGGNASVNERAPAVRDGNIRVNKRSSSQVNGTLVNTRVSARNKPVRIMSAQTVSRMTAPIVVSESGDTRGLGWDINTSFSSNRGELFPLGSFGHTGFTGTSIWIDRVSQTFVVFMSNRVHPDGKGDVTPIRAKVATIAASAIEDTPIEKFKEAEAEYNAAVAAQIPKFKELVEASKRTAGPQAPLPATPPGGVQNGQARGPAIQSVLNGIDILERDKFRQLDGMKVGLVTNHTGRDLAGKQTIDILKEASNVQLVSLFSPEHGIRGLADEKVGDSTDEKTGLPIYSLYGEIRSPKPEQIRDLDAIVFDIQDIGARFYTYTATLKNVMVEAAKFGKPVFILDRPNPINGISVEGPLADEDKLSFIAAHTTPIRYGLTIGELGMMMNTERKIGADLRVIKMDGWSRTMWFDETGQTWVNPSPNMRSLTEALLYPGIGLLETTNVSVGRGTDTPFEVIGAPWIDGRNLAKYLNERNIKGVRFIPIRYKPNASTFKDEDCGGVNLLITDRNAFNSVRTGIEIATALRKLYPADWQVDKYARLLVNQEILELVKNGSSADYIEKAVKTRSDEFIKRRALYLIYK